MLIPFDAAFVERICQQAKGNSPFVMRIAHSRCGGLKSCYFIQNADHLDQILKELSVPPRTLRQRDRVEFIFNVKIVASGEIDFDFLRPCWDLPSNKDIMACLDDGTQLFYPESDLFNWLKENKGKKAWIIEEPDFHNNELLAYVPTDKGKVEKGSY